MFVHLNVEHFLLAALPDTLTCLNRSFKPVVSALIKHVSFQPNDVLPHCLHTLFIFLENSHSVANLMPQLLLSFLLHVESCAARDTLRHVLRVHNRSKAGLTMRGGLSPRSCLEQCVRPGARAVTKMS